jgi:Ran GTPase-activating protein (RanGAP) involved in mRNA processing and transport
MFGKRPYEDEEYPSTKKKKGGEEISSFLPPLDLLVLGEVVGRLIPQEELMRVVRLLWEDMSLAKEKIQKFEEEGREFPEYKKVKQEMIPAHLQFTVVSEAMRKEKSPPSADQLIKFFVTLKGENLIKVLNLSGNPLGDEVMFYLADFLASNNSLAEIDLSQTGITERGIYFLAKALAKNTSVVKLDIANNSITSHGWYFLSCALAVNPHLKELVLVNCRIDNCYPKAFYLSACILLILGI